MLIDIATVRYWNAGALTWDEEERLHINSEISDPSRNIVTQSSPIAKAIRTLDSGAIGRLGKSVFQLIAKVEDYLDILAVTGHWTRGWTLQVHTTNSRRSGTGYDTNRTMLGQLVYLAKYCDDRQQAYELGRILAVDFLKMYVINGDFKFDAVIPMPSHDPTQIGITDSIAHIVSLALNASFDPNYLIKTYTPPRKNSSCSEDLEQLKRSFKVADRRYESSNVLLVDDVYSSGQTAMCATDALLAGGAHVYFVALTRTRKKNRRQPQPLRAWQPEIDFDLL